MIVLFECDPLSQALTWDERYILKAGSNLSLGGRPLPLQCHPTSSSSKSRPAATGSKKTSQRPRPSKQGLRSKETIERTADTEPDYRPSPYSKSVHTGKQCMYTLLDPGGMICHR